MSRFLDLLTPDARSTPKDEQDRASARLADAVARSNLRWWRERGAGPCGGECLLLAVAPYSRYDLALLDLVDEAQAGDPPAVEVYVANLRDYDSVEQLNEDFPGAPQAAPTPLAARWAPGVEKRVVWGARARDLAASALGLPPEQVAERVRADATSPGVSP